MRVRGSSVRPRRDQPLRCPRASQAQVPCTGEINKRTLFRQLKVKLTKLQMLSSHTISICFHFEGSAVDVTGTSIRGTFYQATSQLTSTTFKAFSVFLSFTKPPVDHPLASSLCLFRYVVCLSSLILSFFCHQISWPLH